MPIQCPQCSEVKLAILDFLNENLTSGCHHANHQCLQCLDQSLRVKPVCPVCQLNVDAAGVARVADLLRASEPLTSNPSGANVMRDSTADLEGIVHVSMLNGEHQQFRFTSATTSAEFFASIADAFGISEKRTRLLFQSKPLKRHGRLVDFGIQDGSVIHLIVQLLDSQESNLEHVKVNLEWGDPINKTFDFLDAACFVFSGATQDAFIDFNWRHQSFIYPELQHAVKHSGDVRRRTANHAGYSHTIDVHPHLLPGRADKLFFTLSSYEGNDIGVFKHPTIVLINGKTTETLASYPIRKASNEKAVIIACMYRDDESDAWKVDALEQFAHGASRSYAGLEEEMVKLIRDGNVFVNHQ